MSNILINLEYKMLVINVYNQFVNVKEIKLYLIFQILFKIQ